MHACCDFFACFRSYQVFLRTRTVRTNAKELDRGRPSGHSIIVVIEVSARSVQCAARGVRSTVFFSGGSVHGDFPGFLSVVLHSLFFRMLVFFAHTHLVENGRVCRNSGFLVQGQTWGTSSSWARCVPCAVCHAWLCRVTR